MDSIITVGITGGIGTGKSMVCRILNIMGYPVFYSDTFARYLTDKDTATIREIKGLFGETIYRPEGLDRKRVSEIVFNQPEKLNQLNGLVHPKVRQGFQDWVRKQKSPLAFNEAAILFETGSYKNMQRNILVTAPLELRVKRVTERDGSNPEAVLARMKSQWDDDQKIPLADYIILNDDRQALLPQIQNILRNLSV